MSAPIPDWKTRDKQIGLIREACREGEMKLQAQVSIATSGDQRATILAGIYVAAATGVIGALLTRTASGDLPLIAGAVCAAISFLLGAFLCLAATMPVIFFTPGNDPSNWYRVINAAEEDHVALGGQMTIYDKHLKANELTLRHNAGLFKWGARLGIAAPIFGILSAAFICLAIHMLGKL